MTGDTNRTFLLYPPPLSLTLSRGSRTPFYPWSVVVELDRVDPGKGSLLEGKKDTVYFLHHRPIPPPPILNMGATLSGSFPSGFNLLFGKETGENESGAHVVRSERLRRRSLLSTQVLDVVDSVPRNGPGSPGVRNRWTGPLSTSTYF